MKASLRVLLSGVIDYAGLFPPAMLELDQAIRNYARYRTEPESWMLGRFICPASRLAELVPLLSGEVGSAPLGISAVGGSGNTAPKFLAGLRMALEEMTAGRRALGARITLDAFETLLPPTIKDSSDAEAVLWGADELLPDQTEGVLTPYYEVPLVQDRSGVASAIISALARLNQAPRRQAKVSAAGGLKLRCGGTQAFVFPTAEHVAFTITACRDARVPLKFTAGLHHPIRHFDAGMQTQMHGFLNVFVAGVLAHARGLAEQEVRTIIEDEESANFRFDEDGLSWKDHRASVPEIEKARQFVRSFGSCSFDEPRDDLRALGLL